MSYNLFLDDDRFPVDVSNSINPVDLRIHFRLREWKIVRSFPEFVRTVKKLGIPTMVSFDHDLVAGHYHKNMQEGVLNYEAADFDNDNHKTGYHCARWLIEYVKTNNTPLPKIIMCHSWNPVGKENILNLFSKL